MMTLEELYQTGRKVVTGSLTFTAEDIIRFARNFDPQPFHVDEEQARHSLFGRLCASGWHTSAGWMQCFLRFWKEEARRLAAEGLHAPKLGPSPGFKELRWLKPVYAGDTITYAVTLLEARIVASRPGWRINTILCEGENQHGEPVIRFESKVIEFA
ncbi:dehydratase [Sinorhizobium medicae]|uniref:Dehydratase n=2 Tax=Sinorhizobium medicae TaxID=110321 RepID=A0A508WVL6_9HYPH|nr:MaoC family dehydratase [Sinorhizobium medicae]ABR61101.1 MaoC domain protein dehydratase [Sinorhizobium medicae WSM419]MBO1943526.1 MaoC family dehydratase [Sinorhizobium medicae]MDX0405589.1 dehydratase [Sinorhizobium medicae]MDX0411109.1 dehydratase [Sinorhizobium medicae]MDX0417563.1 dehydratase [Sinorhizobium medicae]